MRHLRLLGLLVAIATLSAGCTQALVAGPPGSPPDDSRFVTVCGLQLCLQGHAWRIHGATIYGGYEDPATVAALAKQNGVNTLEIVEFENDYHSLADTTSERTWTRVDATIAAARRNGLHVILNLSSYGQSLMAAGIKPTTYDWNPYLHFVVDRVNTQTGVRYRDDPTIAKIELWGEIDAPNYNVPLRGTTQETTDFFRRTLAQLAAIDPNHVISTGGFSYINDPHSGIDWRTIVADPHNMTCDVEVNSFSDRNISVPALSSYCRDLGKPWFLSAWSACYADKWSSNDINSWHSDAEMAAHATDMYRVARDRDPQSPGPAVAAVGTDFWNLGARPIRLGMCDIGPQFPETLAVVRANAP